jgi:transcriptional regulator with XRE-family HTH domain
MGSQGIKRSVAAAPPVDEFRRKVGARLEAVRKARGVKQKDLARQTGISQPILSKLEGGRMKPNTEYLHLIATALGVSLGELTDLDGPVTGPLARPTVELRPRPEPRVEPPAEDAPGAEEPPEKWPPGLESFLERNTKKERISRRERWYLLQSRFKAEPWVVFDDRFWLKMLRFWRDYLNEQSAT